MDVFITKSNVEAYAYSADESRITDRHDGAPLRPACAQGVFMRKIT